MFRFPHFAQECPVCGRPLEVRVEYLGHRVSCLHCGGVFVASDPADGGDLSMERGNRVIRRAEQLLQMATHRLRRKYRVVGG